MTCSASGTTSRIVALEHEVRLHRPLDRLDHFPVRSVDQIARFRTGSRQSVAALLRAHVSDQGVRASPYSDFSQFTSSIGQSSGLRRISSSHSSTGRPYFFSIDGNYDAGPFAAPRGADAKPE
jgi:hypothetical protein